MQCSSFLPRETFTRTCPWRFFVLWRFAAAHEGGRREERVSEIGDWRGGEGRGVKLITHVNGVRRHRHTQRFLRRLSLSEETATSVTRRMLNLSSPIHLIHQGSGCKIQKQSNRAHFVFSALRALGAPRTSLYFLTERYYCYRKKERRRATVDRRASFVLFC